MAKEEQPEISEEAKKAFVPEPEAEDEDGSNASSS